MRMVMKRPIVAFLSQLLLAIRSRFTRCARLEAENIFRHQQLIVIRCKSLTCARLRNIDRLLLVWLYGVIEFGLNSSSPRCGGESDRVADPSHYEARDSRSMA
jgi:hypothetical protein